LENNYLSGEISSSIIQLANLYDDGGLKLSTNCNLYSIDTDVQDFIVLKSSSATYDDFLDTQGNCPLAQEKNALVALYNSTNGDDWTDNAGWNTGDPCGDSWYGVTCDEDNHITGLSLSSNQLTGSIPPEIGNLTNLINLNLGFNQLTGSLPPEITNLIKLNSLSLYLNQLTGSIPPKIGNLTNLTSLALSGNQLTGSIPPEIGNLTNLVNFNLGGNQLTGSLPPEIGNLTNLTILDLGINQFTGSILPEIGNLTKLMALNLYYNALTGSIPPEIISLTNLTSLSLYQNCNLYSYDPVVQNFIDDVQYDGYYQYILDTNTHDCAILAPVIIYLLN